MAEEGLGISPLSPTELNDKALIIPEGMWHYSAMNFNLCNWPSL
jgi:hypothetical protein